MLRMLSSFEKMTDNAICTILFDVRPVPGLSLNENMSLSTDTVCIDPSGSQKLVARHEDPETKTTKVTEFMVSSPAMCLASPVWRKSLDPERPWAKHRSEKEGLQMLDDDPYALSILLDIAHLNFDRVPVSLSFEQLLKISTLCDKYDTAQLVRPWNTDWIIHAQKIKPLCSPGTEDWLFVAWVFRDKTMYETVSRHLVNTIWSFTGQSFCNDKVTLLSEYLPSGALGKLQCSPSWEVALKEVLIKSRGHQNRA